MSADLRPQPSRDRIPVTPARGSRKALCVWWPGFELELERARAPALSGLPLALPDVYSGTRRTIAHACPLAAAAGIGTGIPISQAIALCPSLVLLEPDPDFYDAAGRHAFETLCGWSPIVETSGDRGRLFVGVDGLERLYGPPDRQLAEVRTRLRGRFPEGTMSDLRLGYAPGKFAAWVAARAAAPGGMSYVPAAGLAGFLAGQPVEVLPVSTRTIRRLERLGVDRLERLIEIPEPALVAQFGADGRRALEWATGARIDRVVPEPRERPVRVALDFPAPVGSLDLLHAALDRLVRRALKRSRRNGRSVRGIRLGARLEDGRSWAIRAVLKDPTGRSERLSAFLRSRIALSPPPCAVEELRLEIFRFGPVSSQEELFAPKANAPRARGAIETREGDVLPALAEASRLLRLRLGPGALYRVLELQPDSRIPERRYALQAF